MHWTTPADIRRQALKLWDSGKLLASLVDNENLFPCRATLKTPATAELAGEFDAVRHWLEELRNGESKGYRIVWKEINHRILGRNTLPKEIWLDSLALTLAWIGKVNDARIFKALVEETVRRQPLFLSWMRKYPLRVLDYAPEWTQLLDITSWIQAHPRPGMYLRQVDLPGISSKMIERNRGILAELLDLVLPPEAVHQEAAGVRNFCSRYGFRDKPLRIRLRILDPGQAIFPAGDQDITVTRETFAGLNLQKRRVFITENETNFLAFPPLKNSLALFGAGYGFDAVAAALWLHQCAIHYWGDIDTHGFAILDQLRASFPHVQSLLMDRSTLLMHKDYWITEPQPEKRDLQRLTEEENRLYDDLRRDVYGASVRLEQEMIRFSRLQEALHLL